VDPIKALIYAAVINGVIAVPLLVAIMKVANDKKILKGKTNGKLSNIIGWITVLIGGVSVAIMVFSWNLRL
jgi:Mn2+/Fe2+ NRAMP family transporter